MKNQGTGSEGTTEQRTVQAWMCADCKQLIADCGLVATVHSSLKPDICPCCGATFVFVGSTEELLMWESVMGGFAYSPKDELMAQPQFSLHGLTMSATPDDLMTSLAMLGIVGVVVDELLGSRPRHRFGNQPFFGADIDLRGDDLGWPLSGFGRPRYSNFGGWPRARRSRFGSMGTERIVIRFTEFGPGSIFGQRAEPPTNPTTRTEGTNPNPDVQPGNPGPAGEPQQ